MKLWKSVLAIALCLCLCGCERLTSGSHIHVADHPLTPTTGSGQNVSVANYGQLYDALVQMVANGTTQQIISVERYDKARLETDLQRVSEEVPAKDPIAAYAVTEIRCTIGTASGTDALSVEITYLHDRTQIRQIISVADNAKAQEAIAQSLNACDTGVVLYIEDYDPADFTQMVEDYALDYPEYVMEQPEVTVSIYPESGKSRVVELKFGYHTSREALKNMQNQVSPVFRSAALYVSGDAAAEEKYSQLYSFLTERYDYTIETSITPAYSLLRHGVGDCRAFAAVYAAMCRQAELECWVVSGSRAGENWYWNIVNMDGIYYHVDLLSSDDGGVFLVHDDGQMRETGYLWDFDAYPICGQPTTPDEPEDIIQENM